MVFEESNKWQFTYLYYHPFINTHPYYQYKHMNINVVLVLVEFCRSDFPF